MGIPWDEADDYTPYPNDCYIYEVDSRGNLTDVTSSFSYSRSEREIPGWTTRTRTLGTYIVSDTELDLEQDYDIDLDDNATDSYEEQIKVNPSNRRRQQHAAGHTDNPTAAHDQRLRWDFLGACRERTCGIFRA